jgi:hypothetical protein
MNESKVKALADKFRGYAAEMARESDRGAVIVGAAILDTLLGELISARLVASVERDDELLEGSSAPCSSFGSRIDLAYRIGALGLTMRSSLHLIRKMRNEAAHVGQYRDLASPELQNRLRELLRTNRELLDLLARLGDRGDSSAASALPRTENEVAAFITTVGWRTGWNTLVALVATGLAVSTEIQVRLKSPDGTK